MTLDMGPKKPLNEIDKRFTVNPKRSQADIRTVRIDTNPPGWNGWMVSIRYFDDKMVELRVDYGGDQDMLQLCTDAINKQLKGGEALHD